jgi:hypothetical protein
MSLDSISVLSVQPPATLSSQLSAIRAALPDPVEHSRLIVGQLPHRIVWCVKVGDLQQMQGECDSFEAVHLLQTRAGIWDVVLAGLRTPEAVAAAARWGWTTRFYGGLAAESLVPGL